MIAVTISAEAEADLERIADHIAKDSPARALLFIRELRERCEALSDMPQRFALVPRYEQMGIRRLVHGAYLIFYRITVSEVQVLHILHGAVDCEPLLFPEG